MRAVNRKVPTPPAPWVEIAASLAFVLLAAMVVAGVWIALP